ncbi:MAG: Mur ligase family protein [Patescibacteria group bacterium]|nr:Mur ligase family protein [Patescibacteria group bacterium]
MKKFVEKMLAQQAKKLLKKKKPFIIGVTGSVGKSTTKKAVGTLLGHDFKVRWSPGNYNTEFGVPLAILGLETAGKSPMGWLANLVRGWWRSTFPDEIYPDTLVLEMAADHKGDIAKLVAIAKPDIGIVTAIGESHAEKFGSVDEITREKATLIEALGKDGVAVLNRDDERVWGMREKTKARVVSYGFHDEADVRALSDTVLHTCWAEKACGTGFKLTANGTTMPISVPGTFGTPSIYAVLASFAVGKERGMNMVRMSETLRSFVPPPGRLRYLPGIKKTLLVDDTYNSAPKSAMVALHILKELPLQAADDRRFAVLGDMFELGSMSVEGHRAVGRKAAELGIDYLILVGERVSDTEKAALKAGMSEDRVMHFSTNHDAGRFVQEKMKRGDVVLVKGSRAMKMEHVVKELMAEPLYAAELLCGEHEEWRI